MGKESGPTAAIEGLDTVPVIAIDAIFQPDDPPQPAARLLACKPLAIVAVEEPTGPPKWAAEVLLPQPMSPTGKDLVALQPESDPDYASTASLSPGGLSFTQSSSGSSSCSEVGTPPDDVVAGLHGLHTMSSAIALEHYMENSKDEVHHLPLSYLVSDQVGGTGLDAAHRSSLSTDPSNHV